MKNKKLINDIDNFYKVATSLPVKLARSDNTDFNKVEEFFLDRKNIEQVLVKNAKAIKSDNEQGRGYVSQFQVVSTKAHKPGGWGFIPDDALVFAFLEQEHYVNESKFPDEKTRINIATEKAKLNMEKYVAMKIDKSKMLEKGNTANRAYPHCVAIFKK